MEPRGSTRFSPASRLPGAPSVHSTSASGRTESLPPWMLQQGNPDNSRQENLTTRTVALDTDQQFSAMRTVPVDTDQQFSIMRTVRLDTDGLLSSRTRSLGPDEPVQNALIGGSARSSSVGIARMPGSIPPGSFRPLPSVPEPGPKPQSARRTNASPSIRHSPRVKYDLLDA